MTIPPFMLEILRDYRNEQKLERLQLGSLWAGGDWLFTQGNGAPMYPSTLTLWFSDFLKRNGLPHKKFHALRHTSAMLLLAGGTNIKTVASRLGHTQLSTTNRYVHAVTDADVTAVQTFETMFSKDKKKQEDD